MIDDSDCRHFIWHTDFHLDVDELIFDEVFAVQIWSDVGLALCSRPVLF